MAKPCSRLYRARVEAVEVPQAPLGHPEAAGVVHEDEALLDALIDDGGGDGDVPWGSGNNTDTKKNSSSIKNGNYNVKVAGEHTMPLLISYNSTLNGQNRYRITLKQWQVTSHAVRSKRSVYTRYCTRYTVSMIRCRCS